MVVDDSNTLQHEAEAEADTGMMRLLLLRRCGERNVEDDEEEEEGEGEGEGEETREKQYDNKYNNNK